MWAPRRTPLSLSALAVCGLTLTACSSSSATPTGAGGGVSSPASDSTSGFASTSGAAKPTGTVKLSMMTGFSGPDRPAYEALVKDFNASHPDIQVTMDVQPWDAIAQKLPQSWATGTGPDVATPSFDPSVVFQYVKTNSVLDLGDAVGGADTQINAAVFPKSVTDAFTVDGKLVAVPANLATLALYYNKDMFAKAGIADAPKTQDEFIADAKKLTVGSGGKPSQYGYTIADHATIQMWPILQWMNGGDIVDAKGCATIASDDSVAALTLWSDLVRKDKVSPVGQTGADADTLFSAKKAAMEINGPWAAAGYRKAGVNLGIATVPVGAAGPVTLASTVPLMAAKSSKHPTEAKQFLAWWTGKTAQTNFSKSSGFPPVWTDLTSAVSGDATTFAQALPSARLYLPGLTTATKIDSDVYVPLIGKITRGADVARSAADAAKSINALTGCKA